MKKAIGYIIILCFAVVSEHIRLGGDEDYQSLLGEKVVYSSDYFACGEEIRIDNPNYLITIVPLRENGKQFFNEQIDLKSFCQNKNY